MTVKDINSEVVELWRKSIRNRIISKKTKWPLIYPTELKCGGLVVVGCNPALPKAKCYKIPDFNSNVPFTELLKIQETLAKREADSRATYPYYTACKQIADELNVKWDHVDLFFYRQTKQSTFKKLVVSKSEELNDFGKSQLELAFELLKLTQPKIVLVANAFASQIFKKFLKLKFDENEGTYRMQLKTESLPVFLSSMLSGQRCLDLHSRERLVWHMQKILNDARKASS